MRTFFKTVALTATASLALTACGGGGESLEGSPAEVMAAGIANRVDGPMSFTLKFEGDLEGLNAASDEPLPDAVIDMFRDGLVTGAMSPEGAFALQLGDMLEVRIVEEALYARVDLDGLSALGEDMGDLPSTEELASLVAGFGLGDDVAGLVTAAVAGDWVGVTGMTAEALEGLSSLAGAELGEQGADLEAQAQQLLDDLGLSDGTSFVEQYLDVTGDGPTYDVVVHARDLVVALTEAAGGLESLAGTAGMEAPSTDDIPETIEGITMTVDGDSISRITMDPAEIAASMGEAVEGIEAGDVTIVVEFGDAGDLLSVPDGAVTADFETLLSGLMTLFMGGMGDF